MKARAFQLRRRPAGTPSPADFELVEVDLPQPAEGQLLVRNLFLSVDPYMRGRMQEGKSYVPPFELGRPLEGAAVGRVERSRHPDFAEGDLVRGMQGWRDAFVSDGRGLKKLDPLAPAQAYLGTLGMPGLTAYVGLLDIGLLRERETVLVSAAAGAVGSVAC